MTMRTIGQWSAIMVCGLAAAALAISQAFVIHDHVAKVHGQVTTPPPWPPVAQWSMAAGFELAILAVTLAVAVVGWRNGLVVAEVFLVGVSVLAGALVTHTGPMPAWIETLSMSLVPLQYVAVVLAAHSLHTHYAAVAGGQTTVVPVATAATVDAVTTTTDQPTTTTPPGPRPVVRRPSAATTDPRVAAAIAAGVARTTARRWARTADPKLDQYGATMNARAA